MKSEFQLLTDIEMLHVCENVSREGITRGIEHYAVASNKYMKNFGPRIFASFIIYHGLNNQCGHVLQFYTHNLR